MRKLASPYFQFLLILMASLLFASVSRAAPSSELATGTAAKFKGNHIVKNCRAQFSSKVARARLNNQPPSGIGVARKENAQYLSVTLEVTNESLHGRSICDLYSGTLNRTKFRLVAGGKISVNMFPVFKWPLDIKIDATEKIQLLFEVPPGADKMVLAGHFDEDILATWALDGNTAATVQAPSVSSSAGADGGSAEAPITFNVPEGWTATHFEEKDEGRRVWKWKIKRNTNDAIEKTIAEKYQLTSMLPLYDMKTITKKEIATLADPMSANLAFVDISVGPPPHNDWPSKDRAPFGNLNDVKAYLNKWHKSAMPVKTEINGLEGYKYTFSFLELSTTDYQLILKPNELRLFIGNGPNNTKHRAEIDRIVTSIAKN
jgi:hypothetical protein